MLVFAPYALVYQAQTAPQLKLRVLVAPVEVKVQGVVQTAPTPSGNQVTVTLDIQQPTEFGTGLTEMLTTALVQSKRFLVFEDIGRDKALYHVKTAITEFKLQRTVTGNQGKIAKVLDFSQGEATATVTLDLRVVETASGLVRYSVRAEGRAVSKGQNLTVTQGDIKLGNTRFESSPLGKAVRDAITQGVKQVGERLSKLVWEAHVADISDEEDSALVYLNVGEDSGLKVGDVLEIRQAGKPLIDPETGRLLGTQRGKKLAECTVVELSAEVTTVKTTPKSGIKAGDIALFLQRPPKH